MCSRAGVLCRCIEASTPQGNDTTFMLVGRGEVMVGDTGARVRFGEGGDAYEQLDGDEQGRNEEGN